MSQEKDRLEDSPSRAKSYGADVPFAEIPSAPSQITPSHSPPNSEHEENVDLEAAGQKRSIIDTNAEANQKEEQQTIIHIDSDGERADPNIVGWDGPNDPKNPLNWSDRAKWNNILVVSAITFLT